MEHRWGSRIRIDTPAELQTDEGVCASAVLRNASMSGAFLETSEKFRLFSHVALRPLARDSDWLDGSVVRVDPNGMAIEWRDPGLHPLYVLLSSRQDS